MGTLVQDEQQEHQQKDDFIKETVKILEKGKNINLQMFKHLANKYNVQLHLTILTSKYGDDATGRSLGWCKFRYMLAQTLSLTSYYTICLTAIDQFFSTNHQFRLRQMCTIKLARYVTFISICIWIAHSILSGCLFNIQGSLGCVISNPIWQQYTSSFFYPVLIGLLPIAILLLFSLLAFHNVRRIVRRQIPIVRRRLDQQLTAMVL
ncbi:unnamed protein product, partial [Adineta steineri]